MKAVKDSANYRLLAGGEKLGDLRIVYYSDVKNISNFLVYSPESDAGERFELTDSQGQPDMRLLQGADNRAAVRSVLKGKVKRARRKRW